MHSSVVMIAIFKYIYILAQWKRNKVEGWTKCLRSERRKNLNLFSLLKRRSQGCSLPSKDLLNKKRHWV